MSKRRLPAAADHLDPVRAVLNQGLDELDHLSPGEPDPSPNRNTRMRQARAERGLRQPAREGAGRPAEAGARRDERIVVLVTAAEKEALRVLAAGRPLAELLREAPARAARWRAVADALASELSQYEPDPPHDGALAAYTSACRDM